LPKEAGDTIIQELPRGAAFITLKIPPDELTIDPTTFKVSLLQADNSDISRSRVIGVDLGYVFWRPMYKSKEIPTDDIDETDDLEDGEDGLVAVVHEDEKIAGQKIYPLYGIVECFVDKKITYFKGENNEILVDDANQIYFGGFEQTINREVSKLLTEHGGDTL